MMAAGYAQSRPAVHPQVVERIRLRLRQALPVQRALDVGCGAGLSTRALRSIARHCLGIDPSAAMIACAAGLMPEAEFQVARAESLPAANATFDLIAAAGSLNYVDLAQFFPEARRVLLPNGALVVYDFFQGRSFRSSPALDGWFAEFLQRYPMPKDSSREITPEFLAACDSGFRMEAHERFEISLWLDQAFYARYVMTETNVAQAIRDGGLEQEIRAWCEGTLVTVFQNSPQEVVFPGYLVVMSNPAN